MMTFVELAANRYSVRGFSAEPIESEKLERILQAGRLAPSAKNLQSQRTLVVQSPEGLEKINKCSPCIYGAPTVLVVCYDQNESWLRPLDDKNYGDIDTSIVLSHMMLQAQEVGIGSIWIGVFNPDAIRREFDLPDNLIPSSIMPIGYPAYDTAPYPMHSERKPLTETVRYV